MPSALRWRDDSSDSSDDDLPAAGGGSIQNLADAPPPPPSHADENVYSFPRSPATERPISWMRRIGETNFGRNNSTAQMSGAPPPPGSPRRIRSSDDDTGRISLNSENSSESRRRRRRRGRRRFMSDEHFTFRSAFNTTDNNDDPNTNTTAAPRARLWSADSAPPTATPTPSMMSRPHSSPYRNSFTIKSFPPGGNHGDDDNDDDSSASGRRVSFHEMGDEARYAPSEMGMADLPEDSELKINHLKDVLFDPNCDHQPSNDNVFSLRTPNSLDDVSARSRIDSLDTSAAFSTAESRKDIDDVGEADSFDEDDENERRRIRKLLACCFGDYNRPMAVFVAKRAPCFLCVGMQYETDRNLLSRLNVVAAFFYLVQIGSAMFFLIVMLDPRIVDRTINAEEYVPNYNAIINIWSVTGFLVLQWATCCVALLSTILNHRIIRNVDLKGCVRYLWVLLWIIPIELFCGIGLFDTQHVTALWVKSFWSDQAMAWYRFQLCQPRSTYNTRCAMPILGDAVAEEQWCIENYNSTDCSEIRNEAVAKAARYISRYFTANGIWILLTVFVGYLQVDTLQNIISRPLVQKSFESNLPMWLLLPTLGSALCGAAFTYLQAQNSVLGTFIGPMYILAAFLFSLTSILTWLSARFSIFGVGQKWRKSVAILCFLTVSVSLVLVFLTILVGSIYFASPLITPSLTDRTTGGFACTIDRGRTCTNCEATSNQCPEWTSDDVKKVLRSQAKNSATMAGIFLLFTARLVQFGRHLWKLNQSYQIGYV